MPLPPQEEDNSVDLGDYGLVKHIQIAKWSDSRWEGSFQILLKTPTAVRMAERLGPATSEPVKPEKERKKEKLFFLDVVNAVAAGRI